MSICSSSAGPTSSPPPTLAAPLGVGRIAPGPSTTIETLRLSLKHKGIALADVRQLLLTHIHLDHAGATGTLVREHPELQVWVSEIGAPNLVDPSWLGARAR